MSRTWDGELLETPFLPAAVHNENNEMCSLPCPWPCSDHLPRYFMPSSFLLRFSSFLVWRKGERGSFSQPILISAVEPSTPDQVR